MNLSIPAEILASVLLFGGAFLTPERHWPLQTGPRKVLYWAVVISTILLLI